VKILGPPFDPPELQTPSSANWIREIHELRNTKMTAFPYGVEGIRLMNTDIDKIKKEKKMQHMNTCLRPFISNIYQHRELDKKNKYFEPIIVSVPFEGADTVLGLLFRRNGGQQQHATLHKEYDLEANALHAVLPKDRSELAGSVCKFGQKIGRVDDVLPTFIKYSTPGGAANRTKRGAQKSKEAPRNVVFMGNANNEDGFGYPPCATMYVFGKKSPDFIRLTSYLAIRVWCFEEDGDTFAASLTKGGKNGHNKHRFACTERLHSHYVPRQHRPSRVVPAAAAGAAGGAGAAAADAAGAAAAKTTPKRSTAPLLERDSAKKSRTIWTQGPRELEAPRELDFATVFD